MMMQDQNDATPHQLATRKMMDGVLMTLEDVAALFGIAPTTVHKLPLPSLRIGRSLRFDPRDVSKFIDSCKEPAIESKPRNQIDFVFFGMRFHDATGGVMPYLVYEGPSQRVEWSDVVDAVHSGKTVNIRPATALALAYAEEMLEQVKRNQMEGN